MTYSLRSIEVDVATLTHDPRAWLTAQATEHHLRWVLIHADDGVNWGEQRDNGLHLSCDAFPKQSPALHTRTLLRARVFGASGELFLWRIAGGWRARLVQGQGELDLVQNHILWGDHVEATNGGFALLCEGSEGLRHAVPLNLTKLDAKNRERVVLEVQRVSGVDEDKQAHIALSWLSGLKTTPPSQNLNN